MLTQDQKIKWSNLARNKTLRFPNIALNVTGGYTDLEGNYTIHFYTLCTNNNKDRLVLMQLKYIVSINDDIFEAIKMLKICFEQKCEETINNFIFKKDNSIKEIY